MSKRTKGTIMLGVGLTSLSAWLGVLIGWAAMFALISVVAGIVLTAFGSVALMEYGEEERERQRVEQRRWNNGK